MTALLAVDVLLPLAYLRPTLRLTGGRRLARIAAAGLAAAGVLQGLATALSRLEWTNPNDMQKDKIKPTQEGRIAVHIPVSREPLKLLELCFASVASECRSADAVIVVVNNFSEDGHPAAVRALLDRLLPHATLLVAQKLPGAKAAALNLALQATGEMDAIVVVDADFTLNPGFFDDLRARLPEHWDALQYAADFDEGQSHLSRTAAADQRWFWYRHVPARAIRGDPSLFGSLTVVRPAVLRQVGEWDERSITEDSALALALALAHADVRLLDIIAARGTVPSTFASLSRQRLRWTYGPVSQLRRYPKAIFRLGVVNGPLRGYVQALANCGLIVREILAPVLLLSPMTTLARVPTAILATALTSTVLSETLEFRERARFGNIREATSVQLLTNALGPARATASLSALLNLPIEWHPARLVLPEDLATIVEHAMWALIYAVLSAFIIIKRRSQSQILLPPMLGLVLTRTNALIWATQYTQRN